MSVTNPETFKLRGGALTTRTTDLSTSCINRLAEIGVTATFSGGVITITNSTLAVTDKAGRSSTQKWREVLAVADALGADIQYVVAT